MVPSRELESAFSTYLLWFSCCNQSDHSSSDVPHVAGGATALVGSIIPECLNIAKYIPRWPLQSSSVKIEAIHGRISLTSQCPFAICHHSMRQTSGTEARIAERWCSRPCRCFSRSNRTTIFYRPRSDRQLAIWLPVLASLLLHEPP